MINWKGSGRKWSWPSLSYFSSIFLKTQENHRWANQFLGQDLKLGSPKYTAEALITTLQYLVILMLSLVQREVLF
jgi:hypothetical protein